LGESFSFTHFERENLRTGQHGEWDILTQTFGHGHGNGGFTSAGLSSNEDSSTGDFALLDHFEDDTRGSSGYDLDKIRKILVRPYPWLFFWGQGIR
jgi:hypothetical protein